MKKKNLKSVVIILTVLVLGLGGYLVYDKILNNDIEQGENKFNNIPSEIGNNRESINYFSEYLKYIPLRYINSELSDYNISNLTKKEVSMSIWRYIWFNAGDSSERKMKEKEINLFLNKYFNFKNYEVEEMEFKDNHIFGLTKNNGYYIATSMATEYSFANLDIKNIFYEESTQKIIIDADDCYYEMGSGEKTVNSTVTIEFKCNGNNFNIISFKVNK